MTSIRTYVDIDLADLWDKISDDQLREEMDRRCIEAARTVAEAKEDQLTPLVTEALDCLRSGRAEDAALTLERALFPKFKSAEDAFKRINARRAA